MIGHVLILVCPRGEPCMKDGTACSLQHHLAKYKRFRFLGLKTKIFWGWSKKANFKWQSNSFRTRAPEEILSTIRKIASPTVPPIMQRDFFLFCVKCSKSR